jgi:aminoglycoside phosphotransferase (APT) family kinase protein
VWETALLSRYEAPAVWVHGDFAPTNLLVANGSLSAVIDFGCCAVGDPACDLVIAWTLFEGQSREMFRSAIAADQGTWARARGWALWKALIQVVKQEGPIDKNEWIAQNARRIADDILSEHKNKSLAHL